MNPLPTESLRRNRATWAIPNHALPALAHWMHDALPNEPYDPHFYGQPLVTTYYDTRTFQLRKARRRADKYLTLRTRRYPGGTLAVSVKTEAEKFRVEATAFDVGLLPAHLQARLLELTGGEEVGPVVSVACRRYAIEDERDRFTLDVHVVTGAGKCLPFNVLEFKSIDSEDPPPALLALAFNPIKLSKFLWATEV